VLFIGLDIFFGFVVRIPCIGTVFEDTMAASGCYTLCHTHPFWNEFCHGWVAHNLFGIFSQKERGMFKLLRFKEDTLVRDRVTVVGVNGRISRGQHRVQLSQLLRVDNYSLAFSGTNCFFCFLKLNDTPVSGDPMTSWRLRKVGHKQKNKYLRA
jgi:hypothetical protein